MKMIPSETAGTEDLSMRVMVHWGERSQCRSKHSIPGVRKSKNQFSLVFIWRRFLASAHTSRSTAIVLELPGDDA
jgi:hypothetical protein